MRGETTVCWIRAQQWERWGDLTKRALPEQQIVHRNISALLQDAQITHTVANPYGYFITMPTGIHRPCPDLGLKYCTGKWLGVSSARNCPELPQANFPSIMKGKYLQFLTGWRYYLNLGWLYNYIRLDCVRDELLSAIKSWKSVNVHEMQILNWKGRIEMSELQCVRTRLRIVYGDTLEMMVEVL